MHIQVNYYILESIADDFRMCLIKIGNAEEALDRLEYLYMQSDGKAIDALRLQKVRMLRQLEFYKDRYSAFEQLIRGYIEETTALIRPVRWDAVMTVDAPSFKRAIEAMEEEVNGIIRGPFGTRAPNVYGPDDLPQITLDPEVASRNQDVIQHNRKMIENIRDSSLEAHRKCMVKIARLWEIYYNHFLPFEEKDYEYGQKAIALAHQFATPGDRLEELSGNLHSHVVAPAQSFFTSLSNAIEGTLKFTSDAGEYVEAAIETGINKIPGISFNEEWATEYLNDTNLAVSETVDAIVKEPWIVTEGITDSVSYELAENGPLVGGAAILGSVAPDLLGNKGIPRIRYLGKLKELRRVRYVKKVESAVDDIAMSGKNAKVFTDPDTGLKSIKPDAVNNPQRVQELATDTATGKAAVHEAEAAVQVENALGGKLDRVDLPQVGNQPKAPDFKFVDGPYDGKTVDFMWTETDAYKVGKMNEYFQVPSAMEKNYSQLVSHLNKADVVPLDFRNLTPANQEIVNSWIKALAPEQQSKIIILR
ncbi:MAG: hypothetical protein FWG40_05680 [Peptococcaceae bacterium]|nr:hypothetical protein [Peptococcaceae bacterium]